MAKIKDIKNEQDLVDVTQEETHYSVQCEDVRLISSILKPLVVEEDTEKSTKLAFRINAVVDGNQAYSYLEVVSKNVFLEDPSSLQGFQLSYVLMGTFSSSEKMTSEELAEFVKMYTLSILWPYAREYATDQFRRTGISDIILPIIKPQVVTEHIVENDLVKVEIIPHNEDK
jgi:preprotein translocase subunit SecB